jgi:DNA (cytosine-5)-methyltransferase 1
MLSERPPIVKPPFQRPTLDALRATEKNGFSLLSSFSGCGGSCLGFIGAGFDVRYAIEFVDAAADVYELNTPGVPVDRRDIRDITSDELLQALGMRAGELDVLEGSPPCAAFSTAGTLERNWGVLKTYSDTKQRVDDLFFEFIRLLDGLKPRMFVAENVAGLVAGVAKGYFIEILEAMRSCGYRVEARRLDAARLGLPQVRKRIIFIGVRDDLPANPTFPTPLPYGYTIREVLPHILSLKIGGKPNNWVRSNRPAGTVVQSGGRTTPTAYFSADWVRVRNDDDSVEERKWTIDELKLISGFPPDFILTGSFEQQWERIGRAVPPPMMQAVATCVRETLREIANPPSLPVPVGY